MIENPKYYERQEHNLLYELFNHDEFANALANRLEKKEYNLLNIKAHPHCIEISNLKICIAIIIFVGFETQEYNFLKYHDNLHLISFCEILPEMLEFRNMKVTYIDRMQLMLDIIRISEDFFANALNNLITVKL